MLLSASRFFGAAPERALPALLAESRKRQANVTNDLADQVFEAVVSRETAPRRRPPPC
jgi:hypothetical protein